MPKCSCTNSTFGRLSGPVERSIFWGTPMSQLGQNRKYSLRADDVRSTPESGLKSDIGPCPKSANNGSRQPCLMTSSASCRRANFKTVTNEPSRKSFRVDSDRGVAALQLQGGHLRPEAHNLQAAARAAFAQSAEAAPTIAGGYVPALRALRPIVRDKRATRRYIHKGGHNPGAGEQLGVGSAAQRRNRVKKTAKPRTIATKAKLEDRVGWHALPAAACRGLPLDSRRTRVHNQAC